MTTYSIALGANVALVEATPTSTELSQHSSQVLSLTVVPVTTTSSVTLRQSRHFAMIVGTRTTSTTGAAKLSQHKANLFKHFAHYDVNGVDPALALVAGQTSGVAAYDASTPSNFRRVSAAVVVPNDYPVSDGYGWKQAAFVGVGARVKSMAAGNFALFDAAQVELAQNKNVAPSAYAPARALVCNVRPNRLNLGWSKGSLGWSANPATGQTWSPISVVPSGAPDDNGAYLTMTTTAVGTSPGGGFAFVGNTSNHYVPVVPTLPYSFREMLRTSHDGMSVNYLVRFYDVTSTVIGSTSKTITLSANTWTEARLDGLVAPAGAFRAVLSMYANGTWAVNDTYDVAGLIIEQAETAGPYFDGGFGNDYLWEQGAAAGAGRSYYYKDYLSRSYLLKQVLVENSPLGTTPAVPQFGILPLT